MIQLNRRKLVSGVGINDADYAVTKTANGKRVWCPYYQKWAEMLRRCYSAKFHKENPTYIGSTVSPEWLSFMAFRDWMVTQDWRGNELDKDLLSGGLHFHTTKAQSVLKRSW